MSVWCSEEGKMWKTDILAPPIPWNAEAANLAEKKLTFGYFKDDGWFEPSAANARAVDEAVAALEAAGHTCVPFNCHASRPQPCPRSCTDACHRDLLRCAPFEFDFYRISLTLIGLLGAEVDLRSLPSLRLLPRPLSNPTCVCLQGGLRGIVEGLEGEALSPLYECTAAVNPSSRSLLMILK